MSSSVLINLKLHSIAVSFDNSIPIYYFDKSGRLIGAYVDGRNYKRSLDDRLHQQWGVWENGRRRRIHRVLSSREKEAFYVQMAQAITPVYQNLLEGKAALAEITAAHPTENLQQQAIDWLSKIVAFDAAARQRDRGKFHSIYKPVSILPPDQYLSVVLQATEGCAYNQCTFCDFYRDRPFRIKSETEFQAHIEAVKAFFGESLVLRKSIFLADANALMIPQDDLLRRMEQVNAAFHLVSDGKGTSFNGVYSFIDAFSAHKKTIFDFATLSQLHLKRVYIGVETGNPELLRFLRKPGMPELMRDAVNTIKAGCVNVGVIFLVGVGGERYFDGHIQDSVALVKEMNLSQDDIIYLSEFVGHPGLEYTRKAAEAGIQPLSPERLEEQMETMKAAFRRVRERNAPKISPYDIREFVY
jgi:hypothetical protein